MASPLPLLACSFRATIAGATVSFAEVSGLAVEREQSTYRHGLSEWEGEILQTYVSQRRQRVSLKRGVFPGDGSLFRWLSGGDAEERPMDLTLLDGAGNPALVWRIKSATPVKLSGSSLAASSSEVAFETLEVMVSGVTVELP